MPEVRLTPQRDPLLDDSGWEIAWRAIQRWALAIALVLFVAAGGGYVSAWGKGLTVTKQARQLDEKTRAIALLQHQLALRATAGSCSTLFYLVEAGDMQTAGEKLVQASMRIAESANDALYPQPLPRLQVPQ